MRQCYVKICTRFLRPMFVHEVHLCTWKSLHRSLHWFKLHYTIAHGLFLRTWISIHLQFMIGVCFRRSSYPFNFVEHNFNYSSLYKMIQYVEYRWCLELRGQTYSSTFIIFCILQIRFYGITGITAYTERFQNIYFIVSSMCSKDFIISYTSLLTYKK